MVRRVSRFVLVRLDTVRCFFFSVKGGGRGFGGCRVGIFGVMLLLRGKVFAVSRILYGRFLGRIELGSEVGDRGRGIFRDFKSR